jgi:ABC-type sugar transport system substrate-binding protein
VLGSVILIIFGGCRFPESAVKLEYVPTSTVPTVSDWKITDLPPQANNQLYGLGIKPDGNPYKFANVAPYMICDWTICMTELPKALLEGAGAECTIYNAAGDVAKQMAIFEDLMVDVNRPDAVMFIPTDSGLMVPAVEKCFDYGLPMYNYDHSVQTEKVTFKVSHDQVRCGYLAGRLLVGKALETGKPIKVLELWGRMGDEGTERRHRGFTQALEESDLVTLQEGPDCGWMSEQAANAVMSTFPADNTLNAVFSQGGDMLVGAVEGLRALNRLFPINDPEHLYTVSIDDQPGTMDLLSRGLVESVVAHSPWEVTDVCAKAMILHECLNQPIPHHITLPSYVISAETIQDPHYGSDYTWGEMPMCDWENWPILDMTDYIETPSLVPESAVSVN